VNEQVKFDLDIWSGKMCREPLAATEERTLRQCSKKRSKSSSRKPPLFLRLQNGPQAGASWVEDGALLGEYTTRSFGECPNEENVSRLSAILEDTPHPKYYLSAKACAGILRRAERHGKKLLEPLKAVLIQQSQGALPQERTEAPAPTEAPTSYAVRVRGGVAVGIGNGQAHEAMTMAQEVSQTLNTMHDKQAILYQPKSMMEENWAESETKNALRAGESKVSHAVLCSAVDCRNFTEGGEINGTLQAKESGGQSLNLNNTVRQNMMVRRLTPLEYERLQGYPDGWTDIGKWRDSNGKKHRSSDSGRYTALGNSIALPFWFWLLRRISAQYERPATLGSLFDGIGGFPLCWERCNGKGTALWASEIEEFLMAVTKKRFGEG
jgi:hypothetical protein